MTDEFKFVPADYEVDGREPPSVLREREAELVEIAARALHAWDCPNADPCEQFEGTAV